MRDPKLALAIAIHEGAIALIVSGMNAKVAVNVSTQTMEAVVDGAPRKGDGALNVSLLSIEAEFANGRFYVSEGGRERFMDGLAG